MNPPILAAIVQRMPSQEKKIGAAWAKYPEMRQELKLFLRQVEPVLAELDLREADLADSYVGMLEEVLAARLEFTRTGTYSCPDFATAQITVYQDRRRMTAYMLGLALSYFLWGHHFELLSFYRDMLNELPAGPRCLEVGSGHGLLAANLLERRPDWLALDILDISPASLALSRSVLERLVPAGRRNGLAFILGNVFETPVDGVYDWITMGEVLEHVEDPLALLAVVRQSLAPHGRFFVTTCVNSPAVDHIYQFHTVDEIRRLVRQAGLTVVAEQIAPSLDRPLAYMEKNRLDVSYAAVLEGERP